MARHHKIIRTTFLGKDNRVHTVLLPLREINGTHTGEILARNTRSIIEKSGQQHNLGPFIVVNASINDTMIWELSNREFSSYNAPSILLMFISDGNFWLIGI